MLTLLNQLRQSPASFCETLKSPRLVAELAKTLKPATRLHLSTGLCCAARDVACNLRTFGFIAVQEGEPVSLPFLQKYGTWKAPVLENFAYRFTSAQEAVAQIVASQAQEIHGDKMQLCNAAVRVVGIAAARHCTEQTCLVLVFCSSFFDRDIDTMSTSLTHAPSEFFPARIAKRVLQSVIRT